MSNIILINMPPNNQQDIRKYFNNIVRTRKAMANSNSEYRQIGRTKYFRFVKRFMPILTSGAVTRRLNQHSWKNNLANNKMIKPETMFWKYNQLLNK